MSYLNDQNEHIIMLNPETYPGKVMAYSFPGGYPIFYLTKDNGILCPKCVEEDLTHTQCNGEHATCDPDNDEFFVVAHDANWEDESMYCGHCNKHIESAYGDDERDANA